MFFEILFAGSVIYACKLLYMDKVQPVIEPTLIQDLVENPTKPTDLQSEFDVINNYQELANENQKVVGYSKYDVRGVNYYLARRLMKDFDVNNFPWDASKDNGIYVNPISYGANKDSEWRQIGV